jgi:hypothetical protein
MSVSARSYMSASLAVLTAGVVALAPVTPDVATPRILTADVTLAALDDELWFAKLFNDFNLNYTDEFILYIQEYIQEGLGATGETAKPAASRSTRSAAARADAAAATTPNYNSIYDSPLIPTAASLASRARAASVTPRQAPSAKAAAASTKPAAAVTLPTQPPGISLFYPNKKQTTKPAAARASRSAAARADAGGVLDGGDYKINFNDVAGLAAPANQQAGAPPNYSGATSAAVVIDGLGRLRGGVVLPPKPETASRTTRNAAARADAGSGYQYKNYLNNPSASAVRSAARSFAFQWNLLAEKVNSTATKPETASRTTRNAAARGTAVVSLGPTWPVDVDADPATTQRSAPNRNR